MGLSHAREFSETFDKDLSSSIENSNQQNRETTFVIPAKTDYLVYQYSAAFEDELGLDSFEYDGEYQVEEIKKDDEP